MQIDEAEKNLPTRQESMKKIAEDAPAAKKVLKRLHAEDIIDILAIPEALEMQKEEKEVKRARPTARFY